MRASNFKHLVKEGIENTWFNRVMSFASFCILLVGLLICGLATLLIQDIRIIIGNVEDENMAIIYMLQETTTEQIENTLEKLQNYEKPKKNFDVVCRDSLLGNYGCGTGEANSSHFAIGCR